MYSECSVLKRMKKKEEKNANNKHFLKRIILYLCIVVEIQLFMPTAEFCATASLTDHTNTNTFNSKYIRYPEARDHP